MRRRRTRRQSGLLPDEEGRGSQQDSTKGRCWAFRAERKMGRGRTHPLLHPCAAALPAASYVTMESSERFNDFKARFEAQGSDPEATVRLLVEGMVTLEQDEALGAQLMALVISKKNLQPDPGALSGQRFRPADGTLGRLLADPNISRALAGGTHQQGYQDFDPAALRVELDRGYSAGAQGVDYPRPGEAKLFLRCGGADTPRPVTLAKNSSGCWKVINLSSLTSGVRRPAAEVGDF